MSLVMLDVDLLSCKLWLTFVYTQGHQNIINLIEYFEETEKFYLVFEKVTGGQLLDRIATR